MVADALEPLPLGGRGRRRPASRRTGGRATGRAPRGAGRRPLLRPPRTAVPGPGPRGRRTRWRPAGRGRARARSRRGGVRRTAPATPAAVPAPARCAAGPRGPAATCGRCAAVPRPRVLEQLVDAHRATGTRRPARPAVGAPSRRGRSGPGRRPPALPVGREQRTALHRVGRTWRPRAGVWRTHAVGDLGGSPTVEHGMCDGHHHGKLPDRPFTRRQALASAGAGLLVAGLTSPDTAVARTGTRLATGASRQSRITGGTTLVHADLHNHTLLSDGDGDPARAFVSMRAAGLDVAALTDHATFSDNALGDLRHRRAAARLPPGRRADRGRLEAHPRARRRRRTRTGASPRSAASSGPTRCWATSTSGSASTTSTCSRRARWQPFFEWLLRAPTPTGPGAVTAAPTASPVQPPGARAGRFRSSPSTPRLRERVVSLEIFNRGDDYLFEGYADGRCSPLCRLPRRGLADRAVRGHRRARHRLGLPRGQGPDRALGQPSTPAPGCKAAMRARRFFATRTSGLRVDATPRDGRRARRTHGVGPADDERRRHLHPRPRP